MRIRVLNKLYARVAGYFWLPCPSCGKHFGGHEWRDIDGKSSTLWLDDSRGVGICPDCTKAGRGDEPRMVVR